MAYTLNLYKGSKIKNSTKRPSSDTLTINNVFLKNETSLINPTFLINESFNNLIGYTYARAFGYYYFIKNIRSIRNSLCEIELERDPMGSARGSISNYSTYISRASSNYNVMSYDDEVDATFDYEHFHFPANSSVLAYSHTIYVISIIGMGVTSATSGMCWIVTEDLEQTMRELNDAEALASAAAPSWAAGVLLDMFANAIFNPKDYILGIRSYLTNKTFTYGNHSLLFGIAEVDLTNCYVTTDPADLITQTTTSISISNLEYSDFRKYNESITNAKIYLPCAGIKNLSMADLDTPSITVILNIDYTTGDSKYLIQDSENTRLITSVPFSFGADVNLSAGRSIVQAIADAGLALGDTVKNLIVQPTNIIGNYGGLAYTKDWHTYAVLMISQKKTSALPYHVKGRPVNKTMTISEFNTGDYIECKEPALAVSDLTADENETINNYLKGGFYYE